jgi:hypothetical protein
MNRMVTEQEIKHLLSVLTQGAGHEAAVIRTVLCWNPTSDTQDIGFTITDAHGAHFHGRIPGDWRTLDAVELVDKMVEKYPRAFAYREDAAALAKKKVADCLVVALDAVEALREALIAIREASK